MTPELVERVARAMLDSTGAEYGDWLDRAADGPEEAFCSLATAALEASGIVQMREALERIADARTAMDGGSIAECRRIANQALAALEQR